MKWEDIKRARGGQSKHRDLGVFLDEEVYPSLFPHLSAAFPEFEWKMRGGHWVATRWPVSFPYPVNDQHPDRLMVYPNHPWWIKVHGHSGVRFLDYVNGGRKPDGPDFLQAVRTLAALAGVSFPEREYTEEEREHARRREARRSILEAVISSAQEVLWSARGEAARAYLHNGRGFTEEEIRELGLGLYLSAAEVGKVLHQEGQDLQAEVSELRRKFGIELLPAVS
jgi:ribosomal protein L13E